MRTKAAQGFTLLETLIALVITVGSGLLLSNAWSGNFLRIRKTGLYNNVAQLLERKLVEIDAKNSGKKITEISDDEGGFGEGFPQYRWKFSTQPFDMPDLTGLLPKTNEAQDQMMLTILSKMREVFAKAVLEEKVTVFVKVGDKEVSYSVTNYFVDFDTEIQVGL